MYSAWLSSPPLLKDIKNPKFSSHVSTRRCGFFTLNTSIKIQTNYNISTRLISTDFSEIFLNENNSSFSTNIIVTYKTWHNNVSDVPIKNTTSFQGVFSIVLFLSFAFLSLPVCHLSTPAYLSI